MLSKFTITGYSCFDFLEVPKLARVNLVTGRNGSGKTALLEALRLYADAGAWETLVEIMHERRALPAGVDPWEVARGRFLVGGAAPAPEGSIPVGTRPGGASFRGNDVISMWCVFGLPNGHVTHDLEQPRPADADQSFQAARDGRDGQIARGINLDASHRGGRRPPALAPHERVPLGGLTESEMERLWGRAEFITAAEAAVLAGLRSLRPDVERVTFRELRQGHPYPVVKLSGQDGAVPMASLGDGVQRAFGLLLALYGARGGLLLIDEVDTGLHFRAMEPLWKLLLAEAKKADVQIVATTHSDDAIASLAAAAQGGDEGEVAFIRLDRRGGKRQAFVFDGGTALEMLTEGSLEVR